MSERARLLVSIISYLALLFSSVAVMVLGFLLSLTWMATVGISTLFVLTFTHNLVTGYRRIRVLRAQSSGSRWQRNVRVAFMSFFLVLASLFLIATAAYLIVQATWILIPCVLAAFVVVNMPDPYKLRKQQSLAADTVIP